MTEKPLTIKLWHVAETGAYLIQIGKSLACTIPEDKALAFGKREDIDIVQVQKIADIR